MADKPQQGAPPAGAAVNHGGGARGDCDTLLAVLREVHGTIQALAMDEADTIQGMDVAGCEELISLADRASRGLVALRSAAYRVLEAGGGWQVKGDASLGAFAGRVTGTGPGGGRAQVAWARTLGQLPVLEQQLRAGGISADHVAVVTRVMSKGDPAARLAALQSPAGARVLAMGTGLSAARFAPLVEQFAAGADPHGANSDHEQVRARRFVRIFSRAGGVGGQFFLDQVAGTVVREAIAAARARPGEDDQRTSEQRDADALADIARLVLDNGKLKPGAKVRPHAIVIVHTNHQANDQHAASPTPAQQTTPTPATRAVARDGADAEPGAPGPEKRAVVDHTSGAKTPGQGDTSQPVAFGRPQRGSSQPQIAAASSGVDPERVGHCTVGIGPQGDPVTFTDGTPLAPTAAARLLCDAQWTRVVISPASKVLDLGQSVRLFERELRQAIIARDQTCRWKGCHRPAIWGEIHHITYFVNGGPTSVDNGILLCGFHHQETHRRNLSIIFTHHGVAFLTPAGEEVSYTDHPETLRRRARASPAA